MFCYHGSMLDHIHSRVVPFTSASHSLPLLTYLIVVYLLRPVIERQRGQASKVGP